MGYGLNGLHPCYSLAHHRMNLGQQQMKPSVVVKRSIVLDGHKTSVSLEDAFWSSLKEIADAQGITPSAMVAEIDKTREQANLSSAIRLFVLDQVRKGRRTSVTKVHRRRVKPSP
jgi:predicted DNA-binding ribbon-helix-helix protein